MDDHVFKEPLRILGDRLERAENELHWEQERKTKAESDHHYALAQYSKAFRIHASLKRAIQLLEDKAEEL